MKKFFILALLLSVFSILSVSASAADVYFGQSSAGGNTGANCANQIAKSAIVWTAGNTYHICGTLTSALTAGANGTSPSPITIKFETGAKISMAACPTDSGSGGGCMNLGSRSWIIVDGGSNGIIESTANGTGLANHINSVGIGVDDNSNVEIKNVTFQNLFVNKCCSDGSQFGQGIYGQGAFTNFHFHDNTCIQEFSCVQIQATATSSDIEAYNNSIPSQDVGWGIVVVMGGPGFQITGVSIHDNDITPGSGTGATSNSFTFIGSNSWCTGTSDLTHLDPIHTWSQGTSPDGIYNDYIYNNHIHGYFCVNQGTANSTAAIFWEAHVTGSTAVNSVTAFNNLIEMHGGHPGDGAIFNGTNGTTNGSVYNNTLDCTGADSPGGLGMEFGGGAITFKNNNFQNCDQATLVDGGASLTVGKNSYAGIGGGGWNGGTFAAWNLAHGGTDQNPASLNLAASYVPNSGSPVIGFAANLTSLSITQLDTSKPLLVGVGNSGSTGVARPAVSAWDGGAYEFAAAPPGGTVIFRRR